MNAALPSWSMMRVGQENSLIKGIVKEKFLEAANDWYDSATENERLGVKAIVKIHNTKGEKRFKPSEKSGGTEIDTNSLIDWSSITLEQAR